MPTLQPQLGHGQIVDRLRPSRWIAPESMSLRRLMQRSSELLPLPLGPDDDEQFAYRHIEGDIAQDGCAAAPEA